MGLSKFSSSNKYLSARVREGDELSDDEAGDATERGGGGEAAPESGVSVVRSLDRRRLWHWHWLRFWLL